jgi:hypothetical protein
MLVGHLLRRFLFGGSALVGKLLSSFGVQQHAFRRYADPN